LLPEVAAVAEDFQDWVIRFHSSCCGPIQLIKWDA